MDNKNIFKNKLRNNFSNKFKKLKNQESHVFTCYTINLINKLIFEFIKRGKRNHIILGTIRFNIKNKIKVPEIPLSLTEEFEYLSFNFIKIANRYYKKLLKPSKEDIFSIQNQEQVYLNIRYLISIIEITINSSKENKFIFHSPTSGNKIVDLLFKKYYLNKYNIRIRTYNFSKIIKPESDLKFIYKKVSFNNSAFLYPLLKPIKYKENNYSNLGFIHHKNIAKNNPYNKLKNDLSQIKKFVSLNYLLIYQTGSKDFYKFLITILKYSFNLIKRNIFLILSRNLYKEIIQTIANQIYYQCCINTIKRYNLRLIICSSVSLTYENILYKACKEMQTTSIFYDYSMGYPGCPNGNFSIGSSQIDCNRNPDHIYTFGNQRCNQYDYKKSKNLNRKSITHNTLCPQIEFAINKVMNKKNINPLEHTEFYNTNLHKISIFDNIYGYNFYISEKDVISCLNALDQSNIKNFILCHNKRRGFFESYLKKTNLSYKIQSKGDFSDAYYSDFVISIGYQSAAIKAAYSFKKPIIFFTENKLFFKNANFFCNKIKNKRILKIISKLTFNYESLKVHLVNKDTYKIFLTQIEFYSILFLEEIGLKKNLIPAQKSILKLIKKIKNN